MLTLSEACDFLHIDRGANDILVDTLIASTAAYIQTQTGLSPEEQLLIPLVKVAEKFLCYLWYYGESENTQSTQKALDGILKTLSYVQKV